MELEKAYQTQNVGVASSGTLTAILETKDARIATLEKEVGLLEQELDRMRLYAGSPGHALDRSVQFAAAPAFKHQVSSQRTDRMRLRRTSLDPACFSPFVCHALFNFLVHLQYNVTILVWNFELFLSFQPPLECFLDLRCCVPPIKTTVTDDYKNRVRCIIMGGYWVWQDRWL